MNELLNVIELKLGYSRTAIVSDINLSFERGAFWTLVGANGQGKSTFIKALLGLHPALSGKIEFNGISKKDIGYVPQSSSINPNLPLTAEEFIAIATPGLPFTKLRKKKINNALEQVKLTKLRKRQYWSLSGGERQRLHIARALVQNPSLIILDEPDKDLDFASIENLLNILQNLNASQGLAVIMVTHNLNTARRCSHNCALFSKEKVIAGKTTDVLTKTNLSNAFSNVSEDAIDIWLGCPHA
jgi:ABC-type Mn2+/Zn2+ transport system ATPase subunit